MVTVRQYTPDAPWDCHAHIGPPGTTPGLIGSPMAVPWSVRVRDHDAMCESKHDLRQGNILGTNGTMSSNPAPMAPMARSVTIHERPSEGVFSVAKALGTKNPVDFQVQVLQTYITVPPITVPEKVLGSLGRCRCSTGWFLLRARFSASNSRSRDWTPSRCAQRHVHLGEGGETPAFHGRFLRNLRNLRKT